MSVGHQDPQAGPHETPLRKKIHFTRDGGKTQWATTNARILHGPRLARGPYDGGTASREISETEVRIDTYKHKISSKQINVWCIQVT